MLKRNAIRAMTAARVLSAGPQTATAAEIEYKGTFVLDQWQSIEAQEGPLTVHGLMLQAGLMISKPGGPGVDRLALRYPYTR